MNLVSDNIYIGNRDEANNVKLLKSENIKIILNVAHDVNDSINFDFIYFKVGLRDEIYNDNPIDLAVSVLKQIMDLNYKVMVHCYMGHNRAPFIVSKYLAYKNNTDWKFEFENIINKRPVCFIKEWMK